MQRLKVWLAPGLIVALLAGFVFISSALAQPGPRGPSPEQCQALLPSATVDPIVTRFRDRIRTAREGAVREERALQNLLLTDATTRQALDAQIAKTNDARNAFARARTDFLWELRTVVPADKRGEAFRCAFRVLLRTR